MPGISIEEKKIVEIKDSCGNVLHPGDPMMIRKGDEDIFCTFIALEGGYFKTKTADGAHENKYRVASIERCEVVENIIYKKESKKEVLDHGETRACSDQ